MKYCMIETRRRKAELGANNWIEALTTDHRLAGAVVAEVALLMGRGLDVQVDVRRLDLEPPLWLVEEPVDDRRGLNPRYPEAHSWRWDFKIIGGGNAALIKHLRAIPRALADDKDDEYCAIQPAGRGFVTPCPGWDMMGLLDHDHVDNDFLFGEGLGSGMGRFKLYRGGLRGTSAAAAAYVRRSLASDYFLDRVAKYKAWRGRLLKTARPWDADLKKDRR